MTFFLKNKFFFQKNDQKFNFFQIFKLKKKFEKFNIF